MTAPGDRDPRQDAPLELELADVPRHLPRGPARISEPGLGAGGLGAPMPVIDRRGAGPLDRSRLPPAGPALLDDPSPWPARIVLLVVLAAVGYGAYRGYRWLFRKNVVSVHSPYRTSTGVTIDLPGRTGWRTDRRLHVKETFGNDGWMRGDVMFRATVPREANQFVVALRVHAPGGFARTVDPEQMRVGLERALQQSVADAGAMARGLACAYDSSWRSGQGVACYGRISLPDRELPGGVYLWVQNDDDMIGLGYANAGGSLDGLEPMVRSAR